MRLDRRLLPSLLLGVGLGGFVDGILMHQVFQWHHMVEGAGDEILTDGLFHIATWLITLVGSVMAVRAWQRGRLAPPWSAHWGAVIAGWGLFNVGDSVNHLLGIHQVREDIGGPIEWDIGFFVFALLLLAAGSWILRRHGPAQPDPEGHAERHG